MITDRYGTKIRTGLHVEDLRRGKRQRGQVVGSLVNYVDGNAKDEVMVTWETGEEETLPARDVVIATQMFGFGASGNH